MNIYIDESGSFVSAAKTGAWNAISALAVPEKARALLKEAIADLKRRSGRIGARELKINEVAEQDYFAFIQQLTRADLLLFGIATDAGINTLEAVRAHQSEQVSMMRNNVNKIVHPVGRAGATLLCDQIEKLSPQLYVQLFCQVQLMYEVIAESVNYYAQRCPVTLRSFRWRVDQKDAQRKAPFEDAFEKITPALLQTMSIQRPFIMIRGLDYSPMKRYEFAPDKAPTYLRDTYGIETGDHSWDVGKIMRDDIAFVDSKDSTGVQVVDLLTSGIRKCLRMNFENNEKAALLLGSLMLRPLRLKSERTDGPMPLVSFGDDAFVGEGTDQIISLMRRSAKHPL